MSLSVSIKLSPAQLRDPTFPKLVDSVIERQELLTLQVFLEITETVLLTNKERITVALEQLLNLGVQLAVDDCRTGDSSLAYLGDQPLHQLGIDATLDVTLCMATGSESRAQTLALSA